MVYDVLVVGGGPGGLYAAWRLALDGLAVLVCEEHETIGEPVHCTGVLGADSFDEFFLSRSSVLNPLATVRFVSPSGLRVSYTPPTPMAVVIDRSVFDRQLAAGARAAGAEVRTGARISSLEVTASGVRAVAGETLVRARMAILACGASYALQRRIGLGLPRAYLQTAQCERPARGLGIVEVHLGSGIAPGGFAWAVPVDRPSGPHVKIGVMAARKCLGWYDRMCRRLAPEWGLPSDTRQPRLKILPLGPINRTFADRVLAIGDAAGLVKPTTGGGIYYSLMSAAIATGVAVRALARDRLDAGTLSAYDRRWRDRLDRELTAQSALRAAAEAMNDRDIDELFHLAQTDGILPIVRRTASFNQHRHLIRALFKHPPARRVLFRSLAG